MAREATPTVYTWKIVCGDLIVHLASSSKGAMRVGLSMDEGVSSSAYFRSRLPTGKPVQSYHPNRVLAASVTSALQNDPSPPLPPMDVHLTPFQWQVLCAASGIPFGETATYGQLAARVGRPKAARAVGQVMHRNPLPLIFP
jgi:methylated-DNA-[protein]-cysteine S-methyltransferase